jgi:tetratricopeptide (TPR) repeat protein
MIQRGSLLVALVIGGSAFGSESKERFLEEQPPKSAAVKVVDVPTDPATAMFESVDYRGAQQLMVEPEFVHFCRRGIELIYERRYPDALRYFGEVSEIYPNTGVAEVAEVLVWQAKMTENYDYRYDDEYEVAAERAREALESAIETPGNEGWEHFMMAGMAGIEAIHSARKSKYLSALTSAFSAIDHMESAREAAPDFVDLALADGMYNYWRTVITRKSKLLPDFGDNREEGMDQIRRVEQAGIFLGPAATLALSFSYYEERQMKEALDANLSNQRLYPDNTINLMMLGSVYLAMKRFDSALRTWDRILVVDPEARRVHYYKGLTFYRSNRFDEAESSFKTYLSLSELEESQISWVNYRLGALEHGRKDYQAAETYYKEAVRLTGHKSAKSALDRMKKARKEGRIDY